MFVSRLLSFVVASFVLVAPIDSRRVSIDALSDTVCALQSDNADFNKSVDKFSFFLFFYFFCPHARAAFLSRLYTTSMRLRPTSIGEQPLPLYVRPADICRQFHQRRRVERLAQLNHRRHISIVIHRIYITFNCGPAVPRAHWTKKRAKNIVANVSTILIRVYNSNGPYSLLGVCAKKWSRQSSVGRDEASFNPPKWPSVHLQSSVS